MLCLHSKNLQATVVSVKVSLESQNLKNESLFVFIIMDIHTKILNKITVNWIQEFINKSSTMIM